MMINNTKQITWVSDFFVEELNGGAELNDAAIMEVLTDSGYSVNKLKSDQVGAESFNKNNTYIFSNFAKIKSRETFESIVNKLTDDEITYFIVENDAKYCVHRNPFLHGSSLICNCYSRNSFVHMFYFFAQVIFTQTQFHDQLFDLNIYCNNVCLGTNLWRREELKLLNELKEIKSSNGKYLIFNSQHYHKNTQGAVEYAVKNGLEYELIAGLKWPDLMKKLAQSEGIIFIPKLTESASRWIFEAKYLGKKVITNKLVGYAREEWWNKDNIDFDSIFDKAKKTLLCELQNQRPEISIFCTTYNSQNYIRDYLENVTSFNAPNYEVVIYDGGSTDKTVEIVEYFQKIKSPIRFYTNKHPLKDGIYKGWNKALSKCKANIVINMNADDRFAKDSIMKLYAKINENDFVYSDSFVTKTPNETFEKHTRIGELNWPEYDKESLKKYCYGGHYPMWRKKWINKIGLFDESFQSAGDWDFWIRLSEANAKFTHLKEKLGLYLFNEDGKSTTDNGASLINKQESTKIVQKYS